MKILFSALVMIISSSLFANEVQNIVAISADGSEISYLLSEVLRIDVVANETEGSMTVVSKDGFENEGFQEILFTTVPTSVGEMEIPNVYVFPNPVTNFLYIQGANDSANLLVYDLNGKCLLKETGSEVDVASLSQGTYILQINNQFVKFIKK